MELSPRAFCVGLGALLLDLVSVAAAHGHDEMEHTNGMESVNSHPEISNSSVPVALSYFRHPEYSGLMLAHILIMSMAWIFVLPLGVMLSIARSRLGPITQSLFVVLNAVGAFFGTIYSRKMPDLYPHNAHRSLGWLLTWIACGQIFLAILQAYTRGDKEHLHMYERVAFIQVSAQAMAEHGHNHSTGGIDNFRFSNDSGQGTERNTESLRSHSTSSIDDENNETAGFTLYRGYDTQHDSTEKGILACSAFEKFFAKKLLALLSARAVLMVELVYMATNRLILILGFMGLATGVVTYAGIFQGVEIFSGLAHFIKGGVFFWYGILTLGRWAGCFADLGWAWNVKPSMTLVGTRRAGIPSAEFVESFLIFFYGSTNVFLEHLRGWGQQWSPSDLEHVSITIMFFGGGLCGMLVESKVIREMLNASMVQISQTSRMHTYAEEQHVESLWQPPTTYNFSMNPLPALIILLLGLMMSSHHQESMVSTMVHKQWGNLLVGAAFSRFVTYLVFYLSPPSSLLPSRPPTELITAFCLISGGLLFMMSSHDIMLATEHNALNAMFVFTVAIGVVTFLMAWIVFVIAIKGWAVRKEADRLSCGATETRSLT